MNRTRAVEVRIQAVFPVSSLSAANATPGARVSAVAQRTNMERFIFLNLL